LTRQGQDQLGLAEAITGMGNPMDASIAPRSASRSERSTDLEASRLSRRASLLLILALSLGLWAAIWLAVASLASVVVG
jgi:hypothetical protein